jgi:enamine deaminase RidA (YjgF/YER057c/UK114 family)
VPGTGPRFFGGPLERLGALQAFASCGADLVFTAGMTGHDIETGQLARDLHDIPQELRSRLDTGMVIADVPESRIRAQTLTALEHVRRAVEEAGSSMERLLRLRLFLRDIRDCASAAAVVKSVLGPNTPVTTVVEASGAGTAHDVDVVVDAVAARTDAALDPRHVFVDGFEKLCGGFPAATLAGPYVFTTPVSAADPESGEIRPRRERLTADEQELLEREYFNPRDEALAIEQVLMWRNIRRVLEAAGVSFENIVHQNNWLTLSMQDYVPVTRVRSRLFGRAAARTAATSLPISALRTCGAAFECSVIGLGGDGSDAPVRKEIQLDSHGVGPYYVGAVKAGRYVFAAGEVPVRAAPGHTPRLVARAAELEDGLRLLGLGRVHAEYPLMAQAHCVFGLVSEGLSKYGCGLHDVLHQSIYLVEPAQYPAVERIASLHYGVRLPPTTLVPIRGASPFRDCLLEIEVTALVSP